MRILIAGCGYVGLRTGKALIAQGHEVFGLRRSVSGLNEVKEFGLIPLGFDLVQWTGVTLPEVDVLLHTASSARGGSDAYRQIYIEGTSNLLKWAAASKVQQFVYTSSTGVYSQDDGSWVTENSPATPTSDSSAILIEAEALIRASTLKSTIFRVAGIYGPNRGYHLKQFLAGTATVASEPRFLNMVHVQDIAAALSLAVARRYTGIYNLVDCLPVSDHDLYAWLARRLNKPFPPISNESRRTATNKRVSNKKLVQELHYEFLFPTFEQGFEAEIQRIDMEADEEKS